MAVALVLYVFWPVISEFFIKWAEQQGLYDDPQSTVDRAVSGFFSYADVWWIQWIAIFGVGCVAGLWVDSFLRRVPSLNTAVTPLNFSRIESAKRAQRGCGKRAQPFPREIASLVKFKMDGSISSESVGICHHAAFTSPCEGKLFAMILYGDDIDDPMVRVYSTRADLTWRDMGINDRALFLEVTGDLSLSEIAIDVFPAPDDMEDGGPMLGESYDAHWLPDLDGWLGNPKIRHAYRRQTLDQKHR